MDTKQAGKGFSKKEGVLGILVLLIISVVAWQMLNSTPSPSAPTSVQQKEEEYSNTEAYIDAQAIVKKALKSPSTAKFPSSSAAKITRAEDNIFNVESYVDSQNSFGAMIRSDWSVMFQYVGDQLDTYAISIDGETIYKKAGI